jgi:hypothetical protein
VDRVTVAGPSISIGVGITGSASWPLALLPWPEVIR